MAQRPRAELHPAGDMADDLSVVDQLGDTGAERVLVVVPHVDRVDRIEILPHCFAVVGRAEERALLAVRLVNGSLAAHDLMPYALGRPLLRAGSRAP